MAPCLPACSACETQQDDAFPLILWNTTRRCPRFRKKVTLGQALVRQFASTRRGDSKWSTIAEVTLCLCANIHTQYIGALIASHCRDLGHHRRVMTAMTTTLTARELSGSVALIYRMLLALRKEPAACPKGAVRLFLFQLGVSQPHLPYTRSVRDIGVNRSRDESSLHASNIKLIYVVAYLRDAYDMTNIMSNSHLFRLGISLIPHPAHAVRACATENPGSPTGLPPSGLPKTLRRRTGVKRPRVEARGLPAASRTAVRSCPTGSGRPLAPSSEANDRPATRALLLPPAGYPRNFWHQQ